MVDQFVSGINKYTPSTITIGICALDANKLTKHQMESRELRPAFVFLAYSYPHKQKQLLI